MTRTLVTTLYDYQLSLLPPMIRRAPIQALALLDRIGATRIDAAIAERRWWYTHRVNDFRLIDEYVSAWGAPASEDFPAQFGGRMRKARWDLPFWPGLQLEIFELDRFIRGRELVRRPDAPQPQLTTITDLTPWSCTHGELERYFGPTYPVDVIGVVAAFAAVDPVSGEKGNYWARLDWGLLQSVEPAPVD